MSRRETFRVWRAGMACVAANTACWFVFLGSRSPMPSAYFERQDAAFRGGGASYDSSDPHIVAERPVVIGPFHGRDSVGVEVYSIASTPGLLAGTLIGSLYYTVALNAIDTPFWEWGRGVFDSSRAASWVSAAGFYLGTSAQWFVVGVVTAVLRLRISRAQWLLGPGTKRR